MKSVTHLSLAVMFNLHWAILLSSYISKTRHLNKGQILYIVVSLHKMADLEGIIYQPT
jgi:hypothetical protein